MIEAMQYYKVEAVVMVATAPTKASANHNLQVKAVVYPLVMIQKDQVTT
jgi:hypothetical protein